VGEPVVSASIDAVVTEADTARALGSGDLAVLGTPRAVALAEAATVAAAAGLLEAGQTTVGTRVELDHLAPSPVGARVTAEAVLAGRAGRAGRMLTFEVRVIQDGRVVASGTVIRAVVDRARFQASTDVRG